MENSQKTGGVKMNGVNCATENAFGKKVVGYRELRSKLSDIMAKVIFDGQSVFCGNVKKNNEETATIISTELLRKVLDAVAFNPSIAYDKETGQYEVIIKEIDAAGFGDTLEELQDVTVDNVLDLTEDYFENIDKYIRFDEYKNMYPYYLKILNCESRDEVLEVMSMKNINVEKGG